jgi:hypothetical protein
MVEFELKRCLLMEELKIGLRLGQGKDRCTVVNIGKYVTVEYDNKQQTKMFDRLLTFERVSEIVKSNREELELKIKKAPNKYNPDGSAKKAMSSEQASKTKIGGHDYENLFARAIGGQITGSQQKGDVVKNQNEKKIKFSVKAGNKKNKADKLQISLYGRDHYLISSHAWSSICISCIDAFPPDRSCYCGALRKKAKKELMLPMQNLKDFLGDKENLSTFFSVSFFDDSAEYLSILDIDDTWHVFPRATVEKELSKVIYVDNSKAHHIDQDDDQKVLFKILSPKGGFKSIGEVEIRTDEKHYRRMKFWMDKNLLLETLQRICRLNKKRINPYGQNIILYSDAVEGLKFIENESCEHNEKEPECICTESNMFMGQG